jgi:hypothetical protein
VSANRLTVDLRAVGGQMLHFAVQQLVKRLGPFVDSDSVHVEETHGMAQRGGSVAATIDVELVTLPARRVRRVLVGLERIEGARGLSDLGRGDAAFIASGIMIPPGMTHRTDVRVPSAEELATFGEQHGIDIVLVDAELSSSWSAVEAAFERGYLPRRG